MSAAPRNPIHALTGLRLFAALAVYFSHVRTPLGAPEWLVTMQQSGYAGVTFFFVLSGFVLTLNYYGSLTTRQQLWSYAVARIARVYPLYLVVLAWPTVHVWAAGSLPKTSLALHVLGIHAWHPDDASLQTFVPPAWSISVELFLYATLPLLVIGARLLDRRMLTLIGSVLLVVLALAAITYLFKHVGWADLPPKDPRSAHRWLYRTPLTRIGDFFLGVLAARIYARLKGTRSGTSLAGWLIVGSVALTFFLASRPALLFSVWSWDLMYAVPATALILGLALAPRHPLSRLLSLRSVVFLGEVSFAFYLVHVGVIQAVGAGTWATGVTRESVVVEAANLALAMVIATGLHLGVEKPARVWVTRVLRGRRSAVPAPQKAAAVPAPLGERRPLVPHGYRSSSADEPLTAPLQTVRAGSLPAAPRRPLDEPDEAYSLVRR